jgi:hypothetical protein
MAEVGVIIVFHALGRIPGELEKMGNRLAITWYPILFDIFWQENLNGEINGFRQHDGMCGQGRLGCCGRTEGKISWVKRYILDTLFIPINGRNHILTNLETMELMGPREEKVCGC